MFVENKRKDISNLFQLICDSNTLLKIARPSIDELTTYLNKLSEGCKVLTRNKNDDRCIRNIYGKVNYYTSGKNKDYIHFDLFKNYRLLPEETQTTISTIIHTHWERTFIVELTQLKDNLVSMFRGVMLVNDPSDVNPVIPEHELIASSASVPWRNTSALNHLIEVYLDIFCLKQMTSPQIPLWFQDLEAKNTVKSVYAFARVLTILGETTRHMSDYLREMLSVLSIKSLNEIRDTLAHAHSRTVGNQSAEFLEFKHNFLTQFPDWQSSLNKILLLLQEKTSMESFIAKDVIFFIAARNQPPGNSLIKEYRGLPNITLQTSMTIPVSANEWDKLLLATLRIQQLKTFRENCLTERGNLHQKMASARPLATDSEVKINKIKTLIAELEKKGGARDPIDEKKLVNARNRLKEAHEDAEPIPVHSRTVEEINADIELINQQLTVLQPFNFIIGFINTVNQKPTMQATSSANAKMFRLINHLESEIQVLGELFKHKHSNGKRELAIEHSLACIGQYMRDIKDTQDKLVQNLLTHNQVITQAVGQTVFFRNTAIMHDPYADNTSQLLALTQQETLPLLPDIEAIKQITESEMNLLKQDLKVHIVQQYYMMGRGYFRLGLFNDAVIAFKEGIRVISPAYHITSLGLQPERFTLVSLTPERMVKQILLHIELGNCFMYLKDYPEACKVYDTAFDLCKRNDLLRHPDIQQDIFMHNLFIARAENGHNPDLIFKEAEQYMAKNSEEYIGLILNLTQKYIKHDRFNLASTLLQNINPEMMNDTIVVMTYYERIAALKLKQLTIRPDVQMTYVKYESFAEEIMAALEKAKTAIETQFHEIKTTRGEEATQIKKQIMDAIRFSSKQIIVHAGNYGLSIADVDPNQSRLFLSCAISLGERYGHDVAVTIHALGETYRLAASKVAATTTNMTMANLFLLKANEQFDKIVTDKNPVIRILTHISKAECFHTPGQKPQLSMPHYLDAAATQIETADKNTQDDISYAKKMLIQLGRHFPGELQSLRTSIQSEKSNRSTEVREHAMRKSAVVDELFNQQMRPTPRFFQGQQSAQSQATGPSFAA